MKDILTVFGADAITLGRASNRQPELLAEDSHWKVASGLPEATRAMRELGASSVRLRAPTRAVVEDILHRSIHANDAVLELVRRALLDPAIEELEKTALLIIQREAQ